MVGYSVKGVMNGKPFGKMFGTHSAMTCRYLIKNLAKLGYGAEVRKGKKVVMFQTDYDHDRR